jgi:hypothetical protein
MAIKSVTEQTREVTHLLGSSPEFTRTFRVELTAGVPSGLVIISCGVQHGSPHPELFEAKVFSVESSEALAESGDTPDDDNPPALISTVVAKYRVEDDAELLPWQKADVWKFQTQGAVVPALFYYDGATQKPLTNSAGDYFEGLSVDEAQQKVTIQSNRQNFPSALAAAVTNCVNASSYLGFAQDCVKVQGISGERVSEVVNEQTIYYWKITSELLCRQTGWNLLLPDIGFNFIDGGVKKRAFVEAPDGEQVASSNPVALDGSGGRQVGANLPAILTRRVYKQINMSTFFGTPPN